MTLQLAPEIPETSSWVRDPLEEYRSGDFLITGRSGTILGRGTQRFQGGLQDAATLHKVLEGGTALLGGVLPFTPGHPGEFLLMESTLRGPQLTGRTASPAAPVPAAAILERETPATHYKEAVAEALRRFTPEGLRKVVLARSQKAALTQPVDVAGLLLRLLRQNPTAYTFAAPLPGGRTLVGASPELLIRRSGTTALSNPLAGSVPLTGDAGIDRENAEQLIRSAKDLREHAIVVDMVAEVMSGYCKDLDVPPVPELIRTGSMLHLSTKIQGHLRDTNTSALDLAFALHPTPAVCGWPTTTACDLIQELEDVDRGFYAGAAGWVDASGDGEWVVSIRCAEIGDDELRVHAGAGIVPGSDPELEFAETEAKFRTILRGMGFTE
ncbi:isochorismate synthase MenF [Paenarthrobacter sp. NPDC090520]|uniref:isochorismate synthase n=1 Tax=Paenarthrobacter sp. NPDC090520 TaxID=3364382 RepID=UPI00382C273A